jgi:hypothetical protein
MRVQRKKPVPHFVSLRNFCHAAGLYHARACGLLALGVLEPDGFLNGKPIFSAEIEAVDRAKTRIATFKAHQNRAHQNLREIVHV